MDIGAPELLIILVIVVVIFGVGRVGKLGGELGKSLREFRKGLAGDEAAKPAESAAPSGDQPATVKSAATPGDQQKPAG